MPTVAEQLRAGREAKKLTVQQVADATKIRSEHIRALEEGDFSTFSAPIYIRGSVKNYAAFLKLDVPQIVADLDAELKGTQKFSEPPPLTEQKTTVVDSLILALAKVNGKMGLVGIVVLAAIIVVALIVFAARHSHKSDPLGNLKPAVYQPAGAGDTLPLPRH
jgi:cytoskeletal protein RodZ